MSGAVDAQYSSDSDDEIVEFPEPIVIGPAADEEEQRIAISPEYWQHVCNGLKTSKIRKIGSRHEAIEAQHRDIVSLRSSDLGTEKLQEFAFPLLQCASLTHVDLSEVNIDAAGLKAIRGCK